MSFSNPDTLFRQLLPYFLSRDEFSQIAQTTLTGSVASVTFSSIPQTFRTLIIFEQARSDAVAEIDNSVIRFNGDSGNNYDFIQQYYNSGTGASGSQNRGISSTFLGYTEAANSRANNFSPTFCTIPGYTTSNEKWTSSLTGAMGDVSADADLWIAQRVGRWRNTAAITSITILPTVGANWVSGSIFQLYGLQ